MSPKTEPKASFARRLGVSRSTVTRAAKRGRIVCDLKGRVLIEESLHRWQATRGPRRDMETLHASRRGHHIHATDATHTNGSQQPQNAAGTTTGGQAASDLPASAFIDTESERAHWQALALHWTNSRTRLDMDLDRRRRLERDAVIRATEAVGASARDGIERLIDEIAPRLAITTDQGERHRLINSGLQQLSDLLRADLRRALDQLRKSAEGSS